MQKVTHVFEQCLTCEVDSSPLKDMLSAKETVCKSVLRSLESRIIETG